MRHKDYAGKYWLWPNGLRFKVLDKCTEFGSWMVWCPSTNKEWPVTPESMKDAVELTEEQAKAQYFDISTKTVDGVVCGCCSWKVGKEEFSVKMNLGKVLPTDETDRLQREMREFFDRHGIEGIVPYISRTYDHKEWKPDGGLEISFVATKELDKKDGLKF